MQVARPVKFVLNRSAFQNQILYNDKLGQICAAKLGGDAEISRSDNSRGGGRIRARAYGSMSGEALTGALSRKLGG